MDGQQGLGNGTRVAVVGGGICASATAAALLFSSRARGRSVEVRVFEGARDEFDHRPPVVLSPQCRSRLAALGCRVSPEWRAVELAGIEVISGRERSLLSGPAGGLWVVDAWPEGLAGRTLLARALASGAALHGAKFVPRRVDRIEPAGRQLADPAPQSGAGGLVVWAAGANERVHAAVHAAGAGAPISGRFFDGFQGAPTVSAVQARLRYGSMIQPPWQVAKLLVAPLPRVDALYLIPCRHSIYALALGEKVQPADLCQALMIAARDGHLAEGFEISHLSSTQVAAGTGKRLCAPGQLAVGTAAVGHPFQLTLSESLASCSRAAVALVDGAAEKPLLERRYVHEGIFDLAEDAHAGTRSLKWLVRAKERAASTLARAQERASALTSNGVLGLGGPSPLGLLSHARQAWLREVFAGLWRPALEPLPATVPVVEPDLFYVVDDDPEMRSSLTELLESRGARVVSFGDELALFSAVARRPPRAVILDVVLSWVDGLRLCEGLKRHPLTRNTRVVMMSGLNRPFVADRALAAGAEVFLSKPIASDELLHVLLADDDRPEAPSGPRASPDAGFVESGAHAS